ncbi:hypothetical protein BOTBODRAFT_189748 [Botryobasidium botryosum FD-172 SS1]|uniref:Transmembrane protein n=1 Tax=Botryobasidium botryosum (strain FD-172 SS1) TaxID=930990 RepID=A0A067MJ05_BOTB1|nr:hypothetical protein BOTBODRAFT_189748 [Botryobasidium botryosum FD-172 SS1]
MRFTAIFTAIVSFGLLAVAAPVADAGVAVRSTPVDLAVRELAAAPVVRSGEARELVHIGTSATFLDTCNIASVNINNLCNQIAVINGQANADVSSVVALWAQVQVQLQAILDASAAINLLTNVNATACAAVIAQICITICTCISACLKLYANVGALVAVTNAVIALLVQIILAIAAHLLGFALALVTACGPAGLAACVSVGLNLEAILHL